MRTESFGIFFYISHEMFGQITEELLLEFQLWIKNHLFPNRYCVFVETPDEDRIPDKLRILIDLSLKKFGQTVSNHALKGNPEDVPILRFQSKEPTNLASNPASINVYDLFNKDGTPSKLAKRITLQRGFSELKNNCPKLFSRIAFTEKVLNKHDSIACIWAPRLYQDFLYMLFVHHEMYKLNFCIFVGDSHLDENLGVNREKRQKSFSSLSIKELKDISLQEIKEKKENIYSRISAKARHINPIVIKLVQFDYLLAPSKRATGKSYYRKSKKIFHDRYLWFSKTYKHTDDFQYFKSTDYDIEFRDYMSLELETDRTKMSRVKHASFYDDKDIPPIDALEKNMFMSKNFSVDWEEKGIRLEICDI